MNVPKKSSVPNNGWILCPSKSFPGKYYYFNVLSGNAVWSLNDNETNILKKDNRNIQKLNNNSHGYPEPSTPPDMTPSWLNTSKPWTNPSVTNPWPNASTSNSWSNTSIPTNWPNATTPNNWPDAANNWSKDTKFYNHTFPQHGPMFGQPARFMTNLEQCMTMPNIVWTPMVSTSPWPYMTPDVKPNINQLAQASQLEREHFIQNTNTPLCQRFVNYQATSLQFNKENKIMNKNSNFVSSTPKRSDIHEFSNQSYSEPSLNLEAESHMQSASSVTENPTLTSPCKVVNPKSDTFKTFNSEIRQRKRTRSESYIEPALEKATLTSPQKVENLKSKRTLKFKRKYSLAYENKVESSKSDDEKDTINLEKCDLRFLLLAKRKKFDGPNDYADDKRPKTPQPTTPKKKVSFLLENKDDITTSSSDENDRKTFDPSSMNTTCFNSRTPPPMDDSYQNMPNYNIMTFNNPTTPTKSQYNTASTSSMPIHNSTNNNMPMYNMPEENTMNCSSINLNPSIGNRLICQIPLKEMPNSMPTFIVGNKTPTKIINNIPVFNNLQQNVPLNNAVNSMPMYQQTPIVPNNMPMYNVPNNIFNEANIPTKQVPNTMPMHIMSYELPNSMPTHNMPRNDPGNNMPTHNVSRNEATNSMPTYNLPASQDIWYMVVDMDVLLEENVFIDQLLQSDEKCRLLIPRAIRSEIECLCIGDCRGQQRVLVARQISRRMTLAHNQYVVEPPSEDEDSPINTTDAILNCCLKIARDDNRVVLVTNDAYLKSRAKSLNIPCYNIQEIKNGAIPTPKLFSELKKIKVIINNKETDENYNFVPNKISDLFTNKEKSVKASDTDRQTTKNCDILINITKPKMISESDKGMQVEISNSVQKLNLKDAENKSSFCPQNTTNSAKTVTVKNLYSQKLKTSVENFPNLGPKAFNFEKNITVSKSDDHRSKYFQNNPPKVFDKMIDNHNDSTDMESGDNNNVVQEKLEIDTRTTAARQRIQKIMSVLNSRSENTQNPDEIFKIPKLLPFKKGTKNTSSPKESSDANDMKNSNLKKSELSIEDGLKKFIVKNKTVHEKIKTRMDEWICTYTQIMEEILGDILQKNSDHMSKMKISTTNLHESLTCIKMLYDNNKLRAVVECLVDVLVKCSCAKGKLKLDTKPKDFMKIIGCSVLLVQILKTILPTAPVLSDCETYLKSLLNSIETLSIDIDPEILRPTAVCRSEVSDKNREMRNNFQKDPTYVLDYLKKHFKEWSSCNEKENRDSNKNEEFKVVRMIGKNANMLKIDNNKSISFNKDKNEKNDTKLIKLIEKPSTIQEKIEKPITRTILNPPNTFSKCNDSIEFQKSTFTVPKIINSFENTETKKTPNLEFEKEEIAEPKIIRNIKPIDEYEQRMEEPLDLDVLDYSDFHQDNSDEFDEKNTKNPNSFHLDSDISAKSFVISSENITQNGSSENYSSNNENYALRKKKKILRKNKNKQQSLLEDITSESDYTDSVNIKDIFGSRKIYANDATECRIENQAKNINYATNIENNASVSETYTNNDTYEIIKVGTTINENYASNTDGYVNNNTANIANETLPIANEIYATNNENYAIKNEANLRSTPKDDTTNDSGFENESIQANTLVHVFLNELSISFKTIYEFINNFVKQIRENMLVEARKNLLHIQASRCLQELVAVIKQLKSIIKRESHEETELKKLLLQAGTEATTDKRVTRYRQIVRKCLEQAQILESALRIIICITIGDLESIGTNDPIIANVRYINIFE